MAVLRGAAKEGGKVAGHGRHWAEGKCWCGGYHGGEVPEGAEPVRGSAADVPVGQLDALGEHCFVAHGVSVDEESIRGVELAELHAQLWPECRPALGGHEPVDLRALSGPQDHVGPEVVEVTGDTSSFTAEKTGERARLARDYRDLIAAEGGGLEPAVLGKPAEWRPLTDEEVREASAGRLKYQDCEKVRASHVWGEAEETLRGNVVRRCVNCTVAQADIGLRAGIGAEPPGEQMVRAGMALTASGLGALVLVCPGCLTAVKAREAGEHGARHLEE